MSRYQNPDEQREGGWPAVQRLLEYAVGAHDRRQSAPEVPEELQEWHRTMLPAVAVGLLHGGFKQWRAERAAHELQAITRPLEQRSALWYSTVNLQHFFRVSDAAFRGALSFGGLVALYFSVHALSSVYRGRRNFAVDGFYGGVAAGAAYAAHHAARSPTWPPAGNLPARMATFVGLGTIQGVLEGWYNKQKRDEEEAAAKEAAQRERAAALAGHDPAAALLAQLQASLSTGPVAADHQQQQEQQQQLGQLAEGAAFRTEVQQADEQQAEDGEQAGQQQEEGETAAVPAKPWWRLW
ncbi:hypothetical protein C2E21_6427 [Chlorella sorokiniana]|uniref:Uncharacterized protein n=1 Tax=Chlorella sorokiniana TaxID=3076 RepID=A0A2P6TLC1_CHLSO|nr:hypothetical protein C2E21_6427 [Chlorella sorokiniana]|eukprot:PRW45065.1 hypothetical protein C2E21_6427 [Chlorella sorokiniana]